MNEMLFFFEWLGTITIVIGISLLASKKASNPKIRIKGLIICSIGCFFLAIFGYMIETYGVMFTQIIVIIVDIYGIKNCSKEIKVINNNKLL